MSNELRSLKNKVESLKRAKKIKDTETKKKAKENLFTDLQGKEIESKEKLAEDLKRDERIKKTFSWLKMIGIACLALIAITVITTGFKITGIIGGEKSSVKEERASKEDTESGFGFISKIFSEREKKKIRTKIKTKPHYWSPDADYESVFYGEKILDEADFSNMIPSSVKTLPNGKLAIRYRNGKKKLVFIAKKKPAEISLLSVYREKAKGW
jgi:hypothetical protein